MIASEYTRRDIDVEVRAAVAMRNGRCGESIDAPVDPYCHEKVKLADWSLILGECPTLHVIVECRAGHFSTRNTAL
jgi:hypothetical protein